MAQNAMCDERDAQSRAGSATLAKNLLLEQEQMDLVQAFESAGVPVIVLKGMPLIRRLGLSPAERPLADNDFLVRERDLNMAYRVLTGRGYTSPGGRPLEADVGVGQHALVRRHKAGAPLVAEIHWRAFAPLLFDVPEDLVWSHTEWQRVGDTQLRVLDRELTLLHTAAHFVQHAFGEPRILRTLGRAWTLWRDAVDLPKLEALARETGTLAAVDFALAAAAALGYTESAPRFGSLQARVLRRVLPPERLLEPRPYPDYTRMGLIAVLIAPGRAARSLFMATFPPPVRMRAIYGELTTFELLASYASRPFRPVLRKLGVRPRGARNP